MAGSNSPTAIPLSPARLNMSASTNVTGPPMPPLSPFAMCSRVLPHANEFMASLTPSAHILFVMLVIITLVIIVIYVEEIIFIVKTFKIGYRKKKTIWILAVFPVWAIGGLIGLVVPKSGVIIDMICHGFFGSCLYNFGRLMIHYMGGAKGMWKIIGMDRHINTNTLPVCCCCLCLPKMHFTPMNFFKLSLVVMQVTIVRPILWFVAAVMWSNNALIPGVLSFRHTYVYVILCNLTCTSSSVYALMLLRNAFRPELEKKFFIIGKFASVQATLIIGTLPLVIASILIGKGVIGCGPILTPKGRADAIYHALLVIIMLPLSLLGRLSFRRLSDGYEYAEKVEPTGDEALNGEAAAVDDVKLPIESPTDVLAKTTDPDESIV